MYLSLRTAVGRATSTNGLCLPSCFDCLSVWLPSVCLPFDCLLFDCFFVLPCFVLFLRSFSASAVTQISNHFILFASSIPVSVSVCLLCLCMSVFVHLSCCFDLFVLLTYWLTDLLIEWFCLVFMSLFVCVYLDLCLGLSGFAMKRPLINTYASWQWLELYESSV